MPELTLVEMVVHKKRAFDFVLGDNIAVSKDCRYQELGFVNEKDIIGKVI
ncbi:MAG: S26 family signal peptidase [Lachnospiraceae bacterium]|nr:S26 family signal peptidase [Lachnospiraceae bacterium]